MTHQIAVYHRCTAIVAFVALASSSLLPIDTVDTTLSAQATPQMDIVIYGSDAGSHCCFGQVGIAADATAAGGLKLTTPDQGWSSLDDPLGSRRSATYWFVVPVAGEYRLWMRMRGVGNSKWNESVWVQFTDAMRDGSPVYRRGTDDALLVNLEDCWGCGLQEWGWQDNSWWLNQSSVVDLPTGKQALDIRIREDGVEIDQIVLSPVRYMDRAPGPVTGDTTILLRSEIYLTAVDVTELHHKLSIVEDENAALNWTVSSTDAGWSSTDRPPADPTEGGYADFTITVPQAGQYHVWMRLRAQGNSKWNDSVWVQFDQAYVKGAQAYQLGSPEGLLINLENCFGCGVDYWGWQDTAWWLNQSAIVTLPEGPNRVRVLVREDGVEFEFVVLSPARYLTASPGQLKGDTRGATHTAS